MKAPFFNLIRKMFPVFVAFLFVSCATINTKNYEINDYELDIDATTGEVNEEETDRDSDRDNVIDFNAIISPTEAMDISVEESGSDFVEDWSLEEDDGFTIYEVNIENGNDITIDAETGDVLPED